MRRLAGLLLAGLLLGPSAGAQQKRSEPKIDAAIAALLSGRVTDAATGQPIHDVLVIVTGPDLPGQGLVAGTDAEGRFLIEVPAGVLKLELHREDFRSSWHRGIEIRAGETIRIEATMVFDPGYGAVVIHENSIDVGSNALSTSFGSDFWTRVPLFAPH